MSSIGEKLRQERLRKGLSLEDIAERTRINQRYLEALESDQYEKIPGRFFVRSFVRQYAEVLELDPEELGQELSRAVPSPEPDMPVEQPERERIDVPPIEGGRRTGKPWGAVAGFVLMMLACAGIYAFWLRVQRTPTPAPVAAARPTPAPTPVPAVTPTPSPTPAATEPTPTPAAGPVQLELTATGEAWCRVRADGKLAYLGTLKAGENRSFGAQERIVLLVGNAGAVSLAYNGKAVGAPGPAGQVRTVEFTAQGYQVVTRPTPTPAAPETNP